MADSPNSTVASDSRAIRQVDAVVVGAGFAGLYMLHCLRDKLGLNVSVFEAGDDLGGTWYWNRYPGARCDIQSHHYCYSFSKELEQEWQWSERFAAQPEILRYLNHVAERFDLRRGITFSTRVVSAIYDDADGRWLIGTDTGEQVKAQFFISAMGCLSAGNVPHFDGLDDFQGKRYFTGSWPRDGVDFSGQRVGIIGTGSTGMQAIPLIAREASHLTVFQRTPNYAAPLGNAPTDPDEQRRIKDNYAELRRLEWESQAGVPFDNIEESALAVTPEQRQQKYEACWAEGGFKLWLGSYADIIFDRKANDTAAEFVRSKIREKVKDPKVAEALTPKDYPYGTKRQPLEEGYYETFNRDNVSLVDLRTTPLDRFTAQGVRTRDGQQHALDSVVFATGFDAFTGALFRIDIRGRNGVALKEHWRDGPRTYLGLSTHHMPNFFIITGPQSPSVLFNMPRSIEQHCDWISGCIAHMRQHGLSRIEANADAETGWISHVKEVADATLFPTVDSWYLGANIPGKPRVFLVYLAGGKQYKEICEQAAAKGYEGFTLTAGEPVAA